MNKMCTSLLIYHREVGFYSVIDINDSILCNTMYLIKSLILPIDIAVQC